MELNSALDGGASKLQEKKVKPKPKKSAPAQKSRPTRILPTDRITFTRQIDLLRAWAAASGPGNKCINNGAVAPIIKMQESTISLANPFFSNIGLLQRGEGGYTPAAEVMAFNRAYEWNKETASHKLGPILQESWFAKELMPRLSFGPLEDDAAISVLADATGAPPEYRSHLKMLIDYLEAAGIVQREGKQLRAVSTSRSAPAENTNSPEPSPPKSEGGAASSKTSVTTSFSQPTMGIVNFHVDVKVDMEEFSGWPADKIASFFSGIAQVLAAKAKIEKQVSQ